MCGISGLWSENSLTSEQHSQLASVFNHHIQHRGPDSYGSWTSPDSRLLLTHRRLSIVDLSSSGHQPMISSSGRYTIVFNGEIYNHNKLRLDLDTNWLGFSDTETLLALFESHGVHDSLQLLVGMFAFAVWDNKESLLHLCRDRFGEKPLYYGHISYQNHLRFSFCSELFPYYDNCFTKPEIDQYSLTNYFTKSYIEQPSTVFSAFSQIPPGSIATFHSPNKPPTIQSWWSHHRESYYSRFSQNTKSVKHSLASQTDVLENLLHDVISDQLYADVPVGAFLSGGIDSSLVCCIAQQCHNQRLKTFTISFPDDPHFDESVYAQQIAHHLDTDHTTIPVTSSDLISTFKNISQYLSEPFADSSFIPSLLVSRCAKANGLSVALTGDGADELFGGYNRHQILPLIHRYGSKVPQPLLEGISSVFSLYPISKHGLFQDKLTKLTSILPFARDSRALYDHVTSQSLASSELLCKPYSHPSSSSVDVFAPSLPEYYMMLDVLTYLPSDILTKVDRASMSVSLETRAPFLDHRVAQFAWSLPAEYKISARHTKIILKTLLSRHIPEYLFRRPKSGFALPIGQWFRKPLRSWVEDLLHSEVLYSQGILKPQSVRKLWLSHLSGYDHSQQIWSLIVWQSWYNKYISA